MEKVLVILSIISLLNTIAALILAPVIPQHLKSLGASTFQIGLFNAAFAGVQVLTGPVVGSWSDIKGRKFVWTLTYCVATVSIIILGLTTSLPLLFLINIVLAIFEHSPTLSKALVVDKCHKDMLADAYGSMGAVSSLGVIIGPIFGGHLIDRDNGFLYVCMCTCFLHFVNIIIIQTLEENTLKTTVFSWKNMKKETNKIFSELGRVNWKELWPLFFLRFVVSFTMTVVFTYQILYMKDSYDLPQKSVGYYVAYLGVLSAISYGLTGWIKKVYCSNSGKLQFHMFVINTVGLLGVHIAPTFEALLLATIPLAFSSSILTITTLDGIVEKSIDSDRGVMTGASESVLGIGRCLAPLVMGIVADLFHERLVTAVPILFSVLAMFLCMKMKHLDKHRFLPHTTP
ncbi:major facilitator superfamily domain-containing protein 9-like isoform X2 [Photinus pyralis]|nr:major facilitator superfamily domain-containing protein 9-like isoform X2 [Photinus pyralis]XP_031335304.1 major facilitator superfamily domain-containing protein 9-like isoform X2 [Photinus pyralis]